MKKVLCRTMAMILFICLTGCSDAESLDADRSKVESIPFEENQLYAVAYLGYGEMDDISVYAEKYLDEAEPPIHYFSTGEYYLVIPRYEDMEVQLYRNDMLTMGRELVYESASGEPFILCCNISDIFPDASVCLRWQEESVEFAPYISLMDGSVQIGERGIDITQ